MMLYAAKCMARELMEQHELFEWELELINSVAVAGQCWHREQRIELSVEYVAASDETHVRNVILHEIAHALVGLGVASHGSEWFRKAKEIGLAHPTVCTREGRLARKVGNQYVY